MRKTIIIIILLGAVIAIGYLLSNKQFSAFFARETSDLSDVNKEQSVLFLGDLMFDRDIRKVASDKGYNYLFDCSRNLLTSVDAVVANLEGPITKYKSVSIGTVPSMINNYKFTFSPTTTDALLLANIGYVNLGNNHILNFGKDGLDQTIKYLDKAGIKYFGLPRLEKAGNPLSSTSISYINNPSSDRKTALISYNQFWIDKPDQVALLVTKEKEDGNFAVVYPHWGNEYASSSPEQREVAHLFIDAGADAVIGSHPHVIQETEEYKGRPIFYSLGNFIFDQYFSDAVKKGMGVKMTIPAGPGKPKFETIEFTISRDGQTCPVDVE